MNTIKPELLELNQEELLLIDGGFTAEQWIAGSCTVVGGAVGLVLGGPVGSALGLKAGSAAAAVVSIGVGIVCGKIGDSIGKSIYNSCN